MLNFEVASSSSISDILKNHFVTAAEAAADIDDGIKRKRIRVLLNEKYYMKTLIWHCQREMTASNNCVNNNFYFGTMCTCICFFLA